MTYATSLAARLLGLALLLLAAPFAAAQAPTLSATIEPPEPGIDRLDFGSTIEPLGDVNGDDAEDFAVGGALAEKDGRIEVGRVYIVDGATKVPLDTLESPVPTEQGSFGDVIVNLGDLDGDAVADFVVTAQGDSLDADTNSGAAYVYSGATGAMLYTLHSPEPTAFGSFGSAASRAGDLTGDGRQEILVGALGEREQGFGSGQVHVFDGASGSFIRTILPTDALGQGDVFEFFGRTVAVLDDLTGDGVRDHAVFTRFASGGDGRVDFFSGADGAPFDFLTETFAMGFPGLDDFGEVIFQMPDLTGDGTDEILISAPGAERPSPFPNPFLGGRGVVSLYDGATRDLIRQYRADFDPAGEPQGLGATVALGGDLDGDGVRDLYLGAPGSDVPGLPFSQPNAGAVFVFSTLTGSVLTRVDSPNPAFIGVFALGMALADTDGDAVRELLVGAPGENGRDGRLYVYEQNLTTAVVTIDVEPTSSDPIVVPAEGGSFAFAATLTNATSETQTVQAWTEATFPDGSIKQPNGNDLLGPVTVTLAPGQTLTRQLVQEVPAGIPAGSYTYTALIGAFPDAPVASDGFPAVKLPPTGTRTAPAVTAWRVLDAESGSPVEAGARWGANTPEAPAAASSATPEAFALAAAYPNPFLARTAIGYDLPGAAQVELAVYDVTGRRVATLVDEPQAAGRYEAAWNAAGLPSGVYLVRLSTSGGDSATQRITLLR